MKGEHFSWGATYLVGERLLAPKASFYLLSHYLLAEWCHKYTTYYHTFGAELIMSFQLVRAC